MTAVGLAFVAGGVYALFMTSFPVGNGDEERRLRSAELRTRKELGLLGRSQGKYFWAARFSYRHPIASRIPGVLLVVVGAAVTIRSVYTA
jgi:hypothetical protein